MSPHRGVWPTGATADHETSSLPDELGIRSAELGELEEVGHLDGVDSVGSRGEDEEGFGRGALAGTGSEDQGVDDLSREMPRYAAAWAAVRAAPSRMVTSAVTIWWAARASRTRWTEGGRGPPPDSAAAASWTNASGWEAGRTGLSPPDHRS